MSQRHSVNRSWALVVLVLFFPSVSTLESQDQGGGIVITGDDWEEFVEVGTEPGLGSPLTPPPTVVTTDDDRKSLYFSGDPDDNMAFATYILNVTQLPGGATEGRFPISIEARHTSIGGMVIRNLTVSEIDDLVPFEFQASFAGIMIRENINEIFALGTGEQPFDACLDLLDRDEGFDIIVDIWSTIGQADANATRATDIVGGETGVATTVTVMLDLVLGENVLRIDTGDLRSFPCNSKGESGHQLFTLTIGPEEDELEGELVRRCRVTRAISGAGRYDPGDLVQVRLSAENISGQTTITETFPDDWMVTRNPDGGDVAGNRISFEITADANVTYGLTVPPDVCEQVEFSGVVEGAGECSGDVRGDSSLTCVLFPPGTEVYTFDEEPGPTSNEDLEDFFLFLGVDTLVGPPGWEIVPNTVNRADGSQALHIGSNGEVLPPFFSRVAILRPDIFEAENVFVAATITWDDNDWAGIYFRFTGTSDDPFENSYYYLKIYADNRGIVLHRVKDGFEQEAVPTVDQPIPVNQGGTATFTIQADGDEILVTQNGVPVPGLDPFIDPDPLEGCGAIGFGQNTNPTFFDNLAFKKLDDAPCPCTASRTLSSTLFRPGDSITVTVSARNVTGPTTLTETFPAGWNVSDNPDSGAVTDNSIAFDLDGDAEVSYELTIPGDFCEAAELRGELSGAGGCDREVTGAAVLSCVFGCSDLQESGAVRQMLIIGPIDAGGNTSLNGLCDDNGRLEVTDYIAGENLTSGEPVDETDIAVVFGDEIAPDFGGEAGGVGVALAPNPAINPSGFEGILTVWLADANADGAIDFNDADNLGNPLDDYIIYSLTYLENTTGDELPVNLEVGSDDAVKVVVNGELAHINSVCRALPARGLGDIVPVTLEPGINTVLIAVVERGGGTGVRLLVLDDVLAPVADGSVIACLAPGTTAVPGFLRGDATMDGVLNITDAVKIFGILFLGDPDISCQEAKDVNDDGDINITDGIRVLGFLFLGQPPPEAPGHENCGPDRPDSPSDLGCDSFPPCE